VVVLRIPVRIEIAGIVASGKTTLATLFSRCADARVILESFNANPFYEAFYQDPASVAFETEVSFALLHSFHARPSGTLLTICDYAEVLDRAYSRVTLAPAEIAAFDAVQNCLAISHPRASLIVHLICGVEEALRRIRLRGRATEEAISRGYLRQLDETLSKEIREGLTPAIVIDSEELDFREIAQVQESVLDQIFTKVAEVATGAVTLSDHSGIE
jgi:deoxyguanosine kinase